MRISRGGNGIGQLHLPRQCVPMMRHERDWTIGGLGVAGKANAYYLGMYYVVVVQLHHVHSPI